MLLLTEYNFAAFVISIRAYSSSYTVVKKKYFSYLCTYDLYGPVRNVVDACIYITRASGRGLGPGNREFLGPVKWHEADR